MSIPKYVEWMITENLTDYEKAASFMEKRAAAIAKGEENECVLLLEHPPLYTAGASANSDDLLDANRFPVIQTRRGGQYTYHGPGQRVAYVMLDLKERQKDIRLYIASLEDWIISTLSRFQISGQKREQFVGVWVKRPDLPLRNGIIAEDKIAAIGVRIKKWISLHGISINVGPDLDHFSGIVPCGINQDGVTSLTDLGVPASMQEFDMALKTNFELIFGPTLTVNCQFSDDSGIL
ncbi:lipoyl(octanoyl) transferase LipB [Candidatus Endowatersipora endosymbiont of Watersipora subatra]|uniref:lipoyl(octanoyl) transferase LipB n=1 Tax=Candidatus Endowatersipora endosymbiont of Watersipora subatra TaxID=3077946 RepID=UPI00312CAA8E